MEEQIAKYSVPVFPNLKKGAVTMDKLVAIYGGERVQQMETINCDDMDTLPAEQRHLVAQGSAAWKKAREKPRATGSMLSKALGLEDPETAQLLDVPKVMWEDAGKHNDFWNDYQLRARHGRLPMRELEGSGVVAARFGNEHEVFGAMTLLEHFPNSIYKEVGQYDITLEMINAAGLIDVFTGKPFEDMPMAMTDTPDGEFFCNGKWYALELKTPTEFGGFDDDNCDFPGACFWNKTGVNKKTNKPRTLLPYNKPKAYYMVQQAWHSFVLKKDATIWASATRSGGTRVWCLPRNDRLLSLIFSFLRHIHYKFLVHDLPVPVDWAPKDPVAAPFFKEMVDIINGLVATPQLALVHPETTKMLALQHGCGGENDYIKFPDIPDYVRSFMRLAVYMKGYFPMIDTEWVSASGMFAAREANIQRSEKVFLLAPFAETAVEFTRTRKYDQAIRMLSLVRNKRLEAGEDYLNTVMQTLTQIRNPSVPAGETIKLNIQECKLLESEITTTVVNLIHAEYKKPYGNTVDEVLTHDMTTDTWFKAMTALLKACYEMYCEKIVAMGEPERYRLALLSASLLPLMHPNLETTDDDDNEEEELCCQARLVAVVVTHKAMQKLATASGN